MDELTAYVRAALGQQDGYILPWWVMGCQLVSHEYRKLLSCPVREAIWQCEVIGPHTQHRWSDHLISHERFGNGWSCHHVGEGRDEAGRLLIPGGARLTVVSVR